MMKNRALSVLFIFLSWPVWGQKEVPFLGKIEWVNGFSREISGENLSYFSAYPDYATVSLLTRCTNGEKAVEWETAPVPAVLKGKYVYFSWVAAHSSGTSSGERFFDLYLDDEKLLTFSTLPAHQKPDWTFAGPDSVRLVFQQTKRDGANDAHGLAFLRLPVQRVRPGQPVRLKVVGQAQNSNDWYMTFKFSFEEKVDIEPMPFLLSNGDQPLLLTALHFGKPQTLLVKIDNRPPVRFVAQEGINSFDVPLPPAQTPDSIGVKITVGDKVLVDRFIRRKPVVHRELHFIHHSHTDIGYSHLQPEVENIHNRNIDDALAMITSTRHLPEAARFKWNVESIWAVENYLKRATPDQKNAFIRAVRDGDIGLSAFYANILTGMSQPEELFHYTDYAQKLRKAYGFSIPSAMISDVPGAAWATVTALAQTGVRYFSSGPNYLGDKHPYWGDRVGHFVKVWGDKPVWWVSPSGEEKVLFWTAARGYSSWHGTASGAVFERGPKKIAAYLNELTDQNYPYELVQWRYNIVADNGPIDTSISRFVDQWNRKYASPKIVLNTTEKLFETFEKRYGDVLPSVKGDITPYWEDGAVSTAHEEGQNRVNSLRLQQLTTLYAMLSPKTYDHDLFYEAWKKILLFHEHTWGAHNSISHPDLPFVTEQWRIKKQYLTDGTSEIAALEHRLFDPLYQSESRKIAVFNTLSWARGGLVTFTSSFNGKSVTDANGKRIPIQRLQDGRQAFIAENVPAFGVAYFEISPEETPVAPQFSLTDHTFSNGKISIEWDKSTGDIRKLTTISAFNYAGNFNRQGLNSYWYVPGLNPEEALTNARPQISLLENGPVLSRVSMVSEAPGAERLERILTLTAGSTLLEIDNLVDKTAVRNKEAVHFGFPFAASLQHATLDAGYGVLHYLSDQLPGSNLDYLYGRRWLDASSADKGIQWMLLEAPLVEPENMIDERRTIADSHKAWKTSGSPTSVWLSYAMNNYWHTNYKADQSGISRFRYALRPHGFPDGVEMERSASEFTQPLVALPVKTDIALEERLFEPENRRIVVTGITPQEDGSLMIRLYNPDPSAQSTRFRWSGRKPTFLSESQTGSRISPDAAIDMSGVGVKVLYVHF